MNKDPQENTPIDAMTSSLSENVPPSESPTPPKTRTRDRFLKGCGIALIILFISILLMFGACFLLLFGIR